MALPAYLRSKSPERAYRSFCRFKSTYHRTEILESSRALLDLENHSAILLKIADENQEHAERIADAVSIKQPKFFAFAFALLRGRPIDGKVAGGLSSTIVDRSGFGGHLDRLQTALNDIEAELKKTDIPAHGRAWLEKLKQNVEGVIKTSPWRNDEHQFLGWH
jgi:hypothetical protein